jgi:hypothetical protein
LFVGLAVSTSKQSKKKSIEYLINLEKFIH